MLKTFTKSVAAATLLIFLTTDAARAVPPLTPDESSAGVLPSLVSGIRIPETLGKIEFQTYSSDSPFFIYIQDAHAVSQAQTSIAALIHFLGKHYGIRLVGVEGAAGRLDPTLFNAFPDTALREKVFKHYLDNGELAGVEQASIESGNAITFQGIEDWALYEENYLAFLQARETQPVLEKKLSVLHKALDEESAKIYSAQLMQFHQALTAFYEERANLLDFLKTLAGFSKPVTYPEITALLEAAADPDFSEEDLGRRVGKMAERFEKKVVHRMPLAAQKVFQARHQAFVTGSEDAVSFLRYLVRTASLQDLPTRLDNRLQAALRRADKLSAIQGTRLFEEIEAWTLEIESLLAGTERERELAKRYRMIRMLQNLGRLAMTRKDLATYQQDAEAYRVLLGEEHGLLDLAQEFYRRALERDHVFQRIILTLMKEKNVDRAVLVAGGFHREGFEDWARQNGHSYAVITPRMDSLDGHERYDALMQGEVSYRDYLSDSFYDAFARHASESLAREISGHDFGRSLKAWRDGVLRSLAAQGRLTEAPAYTRDIDRLAGLYADRLGARSQVSREQVLEAVEKEIDRLRDGASSALWQELASETFELAGGLEELAKRGKMNTAAVSQLLQRPALSGQNLKLVSGMDFGRNGSAVLSVAKRQSWKQFLTNRGERRPAGVEIQSDLTEGTLDFGARFTKLRSEMRAGQGQDAEMLAERFPFLNITELKAVENGEGPFAASKTAGWTLARLANFIEGLSVYEGIPTDRKVVLGFEPQRAGIVTTGHKIPGDAEYSYMINLGAPVADFEALIANAPLIGAHEKTHLENEKEPGKGNMLRLLREVFQRTEGSKKALAIAVSQNERLPVVLFAEETLTDAVAIAKTGPTAIPAYYEYVQSTVQDRLRNPEKYGALKPNVYSRVYFSVVLRRYGAMLPDENPVREKMVQLAAHYEGWARELARESGAPDELVNLLFDIYSEVFDLGLKLSSEKRSELRVFTADFGAPSEQILDSEIGARLRTLGAAEKEDATIGYTSGINHSLLLPNENLAMVSGDGTARIWNLRQTMAARSEMRASKVPFNNDDGKEIFTPAAEQIRGLLAQRNEIFAAMLADMKLRESESQETVAAQIKQFGDMLASDQPVKLAKQADPHLFSLREAGNRWIGPQDYVRKDPAYMLAAEELAELAAGARKAEAAPEFLKDKAALEQALRILLDYYFFHHILLLATRAWESPEKNAATLGELLDSLQSGPASSRHRFMSDPSTLFLIAGSLLSTSEENYVLLEREAAKLFPAYSALSAASVGRHLGVVLRDMRRQTPKDILLARLRNTLDYATSVLDILDLLRRYEGLKSREAADAEKSFVVESLLAIISADPAVFLNPETLQGIKPVTADRPMVIPSNLPPAELEEYARLLEKNRVELASELETMAWLEPRESIYSPLGGGSLFLLPLMHYASLSAMVYARPADFFIEDHLKTKALKDPASMTSWAGERTQWMQKIDRIFALFTSVDLDPRNAVRNEENFGERYIYHPYDPEKALWRFRETVRALREGFPARPVETAMAAKYKEQWEPLTFTQWGDLPQVTRDLLVEKGFLKSLEDLLRIEQRRSDQRWAKEFLTYIVPNLHRALDENFDTYFSRIVLLPNLKIENIQEIVALLNDLKRILADTYSEDLPFIVEGMESSRKAHVFLTSITSKVRAQGKEKLKEIIETESKRSELRAVDEILEKFLEEEILPLLKAIKINTGGIASSVDAADPVLIVSAVFERVRAFDPALETPWKTLLDALLARDRDQAGEAVRRLNDEFLAPKGLFLNIDDTIGHYRFSLYRVLDVIEHEFWGATVKVYLAGEREGPISKRLETRMDYAHSEVPSKIREFTPYLKSGAVLERFLPGKVAENFMDDVRKAPNAAAARRQWIKEAEPKLAEAKAGFDRFKAVFSAAETQNEIGNLLLNRQGLIVRAEREFGGWQEVYDVPRIMDAVIGAGIRVLAELGEEGEAYAAETLGLDAETIRRAKDMLANPEILAAAYQEAYGRTLPLEAKEVLTHHDVIMAFALNGGEDRLAQVLSGRYTRVGIAFRTGIREREIHAFARRAPQQFSRLGYDPLGSPIRQDGLHHAGFEDTPIVWMLKGAPFQFSSDAKKAAILRSRGFEVGQALAQRIAMEMGLNAEEGARLFHVFAVAEKLRNELRDNGTGSLPELTDKAARIGIQALAALWLTQAAASLRIQASA